MPSSERPVACPARVLVVRLGAIGDVVNALVFAAALEEARPDVHIGWVVHPLAAPLVEGHPAVERVHVWRRGGGPGELCRVLAELRQERYDLAVDLQRIQKSAWLARASGAPRVLGFARASTKEASWIWTRERAPRWDARHMVEQYLAMSRHLGAPARVARRLLPRDEAAERWAEERVRALGDVPVVINLGASKPENRWPPERFGELARDLAREEGLVVCFTGGPDDASASRSACAVAGTAACDLVGRTSLPELVALLRRSRLFIGCDTGPMHLAAALETPVLALFGPADPARTGPYGVGHRVVKARPDGPAPMGELTAARVLAAAREELGALRAR